MLNIKLLMFINRSIYDRFHKLYKNAVMRKKRIMKIIYVVARQAFSAIWHCNRAFLVGYSLDAYNNAICFLLLKINCQMGLNVLIQITFRDMRMQIIQEFPPSC